MLRLFHKIVLVVALLSLRKYLSFINVANIDCNNKKNPKKQQQTVHSAPSIAFRVPHIHLMPSVLGGINDKTQKWDRRHSFGVNNSACLRSILSKKK